MNLICKLHEQGSSLSPGFGEKHAETQQEQAGCWEVHELLKDPWLWSDTSHRSGCGRALALLGPSGAISLPNWGQHTWAWELPVPKGNFCRKRFKSERGGEADLLPQVDHAVSSSNNHVFSDQSATTEMEMAQFEGHLQRKGQVHFEMT